MSKSSAAASDSIADSDHLRVGIAQISPVWLSRDRTIEKVANWCHQAADQSCRLVVFGEALVPGYPFWLDRTGGAQFDSPLQKTWYAHYLQEAVQLERGDLDAICACAKQHHLAVVVGCVERPSDRGGHSLYCSLVYIDSLGTIQSVHRKLMPTYEERLVWAPGDGHGLRVHELGPFTMGALNCWENWMPLARAALQGLGENLHVAIWPGSRRNTEDITPALAKEGRSYVISASALLKRPDIGDHVPGAEELVAAFEPQVADGGSCIAAPTGEWVVEPCVGEERLLLADLDHRIVRMERQNFDPAGHYARPDVLRLEVNRWRQTSTRESAGSHAVSPAGETDQLDGGAASPAWSMPRLHGFTDRAKLVVTLALEAARDLRQLEVLPEHVLAAILLEGSDMAAGTLGCMGLGYQRLYRELRRRGSDTVVASEVGDARFAAVTREVLDRAVVEAEGQGIQFAGAEHLLVALCKVEDERLSAVLEAVDLSTGAIRDEMKTVMSHGT